MNRRPLTPWMALPACALMWGAAVRADLPAVNQYWARVDAIAGAAKVFSAKEAAAFKDRLAQAQVAGQPRQGLDKSYRTVREYEFFQAFENLVKPHVERGEIKKVRDFLKVVSDGKWVQGHLRARYGGDYVTILDVVTGADGKYVFRVFNQAVNPGEWHGTTLDHSLGITAK